MFLAWLRARATRNATLVDVVWAANIGLLALLSAFISDGHFERRILAAALALAWSVRLSLHLGLGRLGHKAEDGRYRGLRDKWGASADRNFFWFFQAQALLDAVLALPFLVASLDPTPAIRAIEWFGAALLIVGVVGETIADRQLERFKRDPANRGRTCRTGLWAWSRHPNYFFEWLNWCAFASFAMAAPFGFLALIAPILMLFFIVKVTGIPPTEAQALRSRGDDYRDYQRTTSAFFPWPPKNAGGTA